MTVSLRLRFGTAVFLFAAVLTTVFARDAIAQCQPPAPPPTVNAWITPSTCVIPPVLHISYTVAPERIYEGTPVYFVVLFIELMVDGSVKYSRSVTGSSGSGTIDVPEGEPSGGDGSPYWLANPGATLRIRPYAPGLCSDSGENGVQGTPVTVSVPEDGCIIVPPPPPDNQPPKFTFELTSAANMDERQARLLTHAYHQAFDSTGRPLSSNAPFSAYQLDAAHTVPPNATHPQMKISGVVAHAPHTNEIWFKLIDPLDDATTARYVPDVDRRVNDNHDNPSARLMTADGQHRVGVNVPLQTTWDSGLGVQLILEGSDHAAGDNYEVIASFAAPDATGRFPCESSVPTGCDHTSIVTVWKRVYIESHRMFREGAFLAAPVAPGDSSIVLRDDGGGQPPNFRPGQPLRLISGAPAAHHDDVSVAARADTSGNPLPSVVSLPNHRWLVYVNGIVGNSYVGVGTGSPLSADAVGVAGGYFDADTSMLGQFFQTMYVDVADAPIATTEFPFVSTMPDPANAGSTGGALPQSAEPVLANRFIQSRDSNVLHLFGVAGFQMTVAQGTSTIQCSTHFGDTIGASTGNYSYVYVGNIERAVTAPIQPCPISFGHLLGRNPVTVTQATVAHEITHQFMVNHDAAFSSGRSGGHCNELSAAPPGAAGDLCLMNAAFPAGVANPSELDLPRLALHWLSHGADSEYTQVRMRSEPVTAP